MNEIQAIIRNNHRRLVKEIRETNHRIQVLQARLRKQRDREAREG